MGYIAIQFHVLDGAILLWIKILDYTILRAAIDFFYRYHLRIKLVVRHS